eukprot:62649_1
MAAEKKENVTIADSKNQDIKLVIYDFDQTITTIHLYHELNKMSDNSNQETTLTKMSDNRLIDIFGGNKRLKRLNEHFNILKSCNVGIAVISFGYVNVIKEALRRMKLYDLYFASSEIIGCDSVELDDADGSKATCIENMFKKNKQNNLNSNQIIFVDDDQYNIQEAKELKTCKTILIHPRQGMNNNHMKQIEAMVVQKPKENNQKKKVDNNKDQ